MDDEKAGLVERVAELERLVLAMADKLATVAEHLGRLAEKRDGRADADGGGAGGGGRG